MYAGTATLRVLEYMCAYYVLICKNGKTIWELLRKHLETVPRPDICVSLGIFIVWSGICT